MLKTLHYSIEEPAKFADKPSFAPVVVLIHGLFGSADNLNVISRHLRDDFRVVKLDLPDHGKSPWSDTFSFENYAQQIVLTLSSLDISRAHFVAHSLGGKVAMYLASIHPSIIDKLIVLDIAPVTYEHRHQNVIHGLTSIDLNSIQSRQDAQNKLSEFIADKGTQAFLLKSLYEQDGQWHWRFNLKLLVKDYNHIRAWPATRPSVTKHKFDGPILFMKGQHSDYVLAEHQTAIISQFPNASAKIVNAGHWLHAEKPQLVNSLITKFLLGDKN